MKNYPIIKVAIFFSGGILLNRIISIDNTFIFYLFSTILALGILFYFVDKKLTSIILLVCVLLTGLLLSNEKDKNENLLFKDIYRQKNLIVFGKIEEIQLIKNNEVKFTLLTDSLNLNNKKMHRQIKLLCKFKDEYPVTTDSIYNILQPGFTVKLTGTYFKGREMRNPGEFDYNKYLNKQGISGAFNVYSSNDLIILNNERDIFNSIIFSVRKYLDNEIKFLHNKETASLLKGLFLADRSEIDYVSKIQFINSGVIHILAVSGLHVGFIAIAFLFLFGRLNIYLRSILTIIGLLLFMFITGVPPSVFRATVMAVIILIAYLSNRSTNLFNSLALAAMVILIINPQELFNPGFQLSFSAVLGIALLYSKTEAIIKKLKLKSKFLTYLLLFMSVSLCAQIGTLPFTLMYFGKLSVISIFANLIVIPLTAVIVGIGILTLVINSIFPFIAVYYASANELVVRLLFLIVDFSGSQSFSFLPVKSFSLYDSVLFYLFLLILYFSIKQVKMNLLRFAVIVLSVINFLFLSTLDNNSILKDGKLTVIAIDVGQGDAILLRFPEGTTALIDAGNVTPYFDNGERIILPLLDYLGIKQIDYGFVSHIDSDHYAGYVSLINTGMIKKIIKPELDTSLVKDIKFETYLNKHHVPFEYYSKNKLIIDGAAVYILNDNIKIIQDGLSSNDKSGVIKVVYGKTSFLFTGDIEEVVEKKYSSVYRSFLDCNILKVAHHGSKTSSTSEFMNFAKPEVSIISAGILNKFNHPSPEIVRRLEDFNSEIYRTDKYGALIFESDGDTVSFIDWKKHF